MTLPIAFWRCRATTCCVLGLFLMGCAATPRVVEQDSPKAALTLHALDELALVDLALHDPQSSIAEGATLALRNDAARLRVLGETSLAPARRLAAAAVEDLALLGPVAVQHPNWRVRREAAQRLQDSAVLAAVARDDASRHVRRVALERLQDNASLLQAALHEPDPELSRLAVARLTDVGALQVVLAQSSRSLDRIEALDQLQQSDLALAILWQDRDPELRQAAVRWLSAQAAQSVWQAPDALLRRWVMRGSVHLDPLQGLDDPDDGVRAAAIERVQDPAQLQRLTRSALHADVRRAALVSLADSNFALEALRSDPDVGVRLAAAGLIRADAELAALLTSEADADVRARLVSRLKDQTLLAEIAQRGKASERREAARRLSDASLAAGIAGSDPDPAVRNAALTSVIDAVVLAGLLARERDPAARRAIAARMSDRELLQKLTAPAEPLNTRLTIAEQLQDPALFAHLAEHDPSWYLRWRLLPRVQDEAVLARIAERDAHAEVRARAMKRLGMPLPPGALLLTETTKPTPPHTGRDSARRQALADRMRSALATVAGTADILLELEPLLLDMPYALHDDVSGREIDAGVLWVEHVRLRVTSPARVLAKRDVRAGRTTRAESLADGQRDAQGDLVAVRMAEVDAVAFLAEVLRALPVPAGQVPLGDDWLTAAADLMR